MSFGDGYGDTVGDKLFHAVHRGFCYNWEDELLAVWNYSLTVNIYNTNGNEVDMFTFDEKPVDKEDAVKGILLHFKYMMEENDADD